MSNWSPDVFARAWHFASLHHAGQTYAGPVEGVSFDYLTHVGSVAVELIWALQTTPDADGDLAVQCAVLHDLIEDTDATYDLVAENFGRAVADGVMALSKDPTLPKIEQMADSLRRIRKQPREIWMVKMADRIANLDPPPYYWDDAKIEAYRQEAIVIYDALYTANAALANRLQEKIEQYKRFLTKS
ncbi:MAG: bifunctional (p)ppGpp synthetase/guanosine-3',5'-bis(diphosphate) 3'-pyrophosphohydrolase [Anaerolineae bacterium]|nr:bifunctional (p)ppGpp synthetase/guanosine-3',5'-bis(diphosphate) 3'-pyrophosphohydrolase [Anaerolineae bacterium]